DITGLIRAGKMSEAVALYEKGKKSHPDWLIFEEGNMNRLGYGLMSEGKMEEAIAVFKINTREYPGSFNVWDSLAEAHLKLGNKELARKYYKKSLELNPENTNAKTMMDAME
ncbi:MAG: tetratricopeptide repeat protein, partial [Sinomicrobium sp.]|nr:tetratricopeptide repeat protein [Sinomicrobium sp.]